MDFGVSVIWGKLLNLPSHILTFISKKLDILVLQRIALMVELNVMLYMKHLAWELTLNKLSVFEQDATLFLLISH